MGDAAVLADEIEALIHSQADWQPWASKAVYLLKKSAAAIRATAPAPEAISDEQVKRAILSLRTTIENDRGDDGAAIFGIEAMRTALEAARIPAAPDAVVEQDWQRCFHSRCIQAARCQRTPCEAPAAPSDDSASKIAELEATVTRCTYLYSEYYARSIKAERERDEARRMLAERETELMNKRGFIRKKYAAYFKERSQFRDQIADRDKMLAEAETLLEHREESSVSGWRGAANKWLARYRATKEASHGV